MSKRRSTQNDRIIEWMKEMGEITQREAINLGCLRLSARIFDFKEAGIEIKKEMREVKNRDGSTARIAVYSLVHPEKINTCDRCGKIITADTKRAYGEEENLCWFCAKKLQLKDERDGEDE